jgi:3',5'-cyclic AMP phosphodiesterase CpdA
VPVYLLPGNHDDPAAMREAFPEHNYLGTEGFIQYTVAVGEIVMVALDTTIPGNSGGRLCGERLAWLAAQLENHRNECVVIAMHHPPFRTFIGHMDEIGLIEGADELEQIVKDHPQIERVVCGHLHRSIDVRFAGTIASTCPSPAHQVCLDLSASAPSAWTLEPPGFKLHVLAEGGPLVSHLAFCGVHEGPYPFYNGNELID